MKKSLGAFLAFAVSGYAMAAGESGIYVEFFSGGQWVAVPGFPNRFALPLAQP